MSQCCTCNYHPVYTKVMDTLNYFYSQDLFISFVGLSYFCAFWSLSMQILGLYGSKGIIPISESLQSYKKKDFLHIPTLFWWNSSDRFLEWVAILGQIGSFFVALGVFPAIWLPLLWIGYLSFVNIGAVFLSFQWDALLLEVGFLAIFYSLEEPPPSMLLIAVWVLLFRFIFSSGIVKLMSGDPEWRSLKALYVHYETQPIPNQMAYYFHQQPRWFSKFSEGLMFFIELVVPFFIFGNDDSRLFAFCFLVLLQLLIILTGNYAFFNLLTIGLCVTLLPNWTLEWLYDLPEAIPATNIFLHLFLQGVGLFLIILNVLQLAFLFVHSRWLYKILQFFGNYYIISSYGLFAVMTTKRDEIIIEGSDDGNEWKAYEFKWKPGDLKRPPLQVAPYHPRLDWQMWFAALSSYQANPWFINFLVKLLEGSEPVLNLLKKNPFPKKPPKYIRSSLYEYHFTDLETKRKTGEWWTRKFKFYYTPSMKLSDQSNNFNHREHRDHREI